MTGQFRNASRRARVAAIAVAAISLVVFSAGCAQQDPADDAATSSTIAVPGAPAPTTTTPAPDPVTTIDVSDMKFSPQSITIEAGQTVRWEFDDDGKAHNVTGLRDIGLIINSPIMKEGEYSVTFDKPGTYDYICALHQEMTGTIVVE
ncbi:cupredoxin domain-containing protein [Antrihabitans spumae]|uniref:Plastocyanin/azurin family copper-binding protein n=1 Tax=Antrihabitans spumae TaxID=3373370 RepID=A0ABW7K515_9NOCA